MSSILGILERLSTSQQCFMQKTPHWLLLENEMEFGVGFFFPDLPFMIIKYTWLCAEMGMKIKCTLEKVMLKIEVMPSMLNSKRNALVYEDFIGIHLEWPE